MKRFLYVASVKSAEGSQTFYIDAASQEEADARAKAGESDGIYSSEVEVQSLGDLESCGETETTDFGDFPEQAEASPQSSATVKESLKVAPQVTLEQAREIVKDRSNGTLSGISSGKGGRAWLDGEWQLCELEALCVMIRAEAGDHAEGAAELIEYWKDVGGE